MVMAKGASCSFFFSLLFLCNAAVTSSGIPLPRAKGFWEKKQLFPCIHHRALTEHDSVNPTTTTLPPPPITNPPISTAPAVVTVPGANPATNPVNPPPVSNPPPATNPVNPPVPVTGGNGRWCIAKNGASQAALQSALDYACGVGGADCATIQQGSSCYEPATLENHASYAFNSYYQKNPAPTSCDFGGAALVTTTNPSTGSCVYPSSSSSSPPPPPTTQAPVNTTTSLPTAPPTTQAPVNTTTSLPTAPPTTSSSSSGAGTQYPPPPGFSLGNPDPTGLGAYGASPPLMSTAASVSNNLRPFIVSLVTAVASIIMFGL
ncbi:putative glucan endo-1,3-beta-D-glucosidase [Helianthus debilis subsp. tardiflorus]